MSSFLCFICHSTVNADTSEDMREKYREVVGMNLCPDSHLCHICCHVMNRLWLFRSVCLKRSLEYPVLFSEKGTLNLQRNDLEIHTVCFDDCEHYKSRNINSKYYHFTYFDGTCDSNEKYSLPNEYVELEDDRQDFGDIGNSINYKCGENNDNVHDDMFDEDFSYSHRKILDEVSGNEFIVRIDHSNDVQEIPGNVPDDFGMDQYEQDFDDDFRRDDETHSNKSVNEEIDDDDIGIQKGPKSPTVTETEQYQDHSGIENGIKEEPSTPFNTETNDIVTTEELETKKHSKKKKKKKNKKDEKMFEKFLLSVEDQKAELEVNRKGQKYIEAEFKCYNCAIGFLFKDTYQAHMMRHEESNGEYLCSICSLRFATTAVLRAHTALHAERHRCLRCNEAVRRRHRTDHARLCFGLKVDSAACHLCGRVFKDSTALQQHLKRLHGARTGTRCGVCAECCNGHAALRTHMIKHIQRRFACAQCAVSCGSPQALRAHRSRHARDVTCACACGKTFADGKGLRAHWRRSQLHAQSSMSRARALAARRAAPPRPRPPPRAALCHLCGGSFKGNSKLNRHLREVCEKDKLEEELSSYYAQAAGTEC